MRSNLVAHPQYAGKGRPRKDASPTSQQWQVATTVTVNQEQVEQEALRKACWIVGTNVLDESGPLRPATRDDLQRPRRRGARLSLFERSAVSGFLGLCQKTGAYRGPQFHHGALRGMVYRLAEFRLRSRLAETRAVDS